jgi:hypothetical protein
MRRDPGGDRLELVLERELATEGYLYGHGKRLREVIRPPQGLEGSVSLADYRSTS